MTWLTPPPIKRIPQKPRIILYRGAWLCGVELKGQRDQHGLGFALPYGSKLARGRTPAEAYRTWLQVQSIGGVLSYAPPSRLPSYLEWIPARAANYVRKSFEMKL